MLVLSFPEQRRSVEQAMVLDTSSSDFSVPMPSEGAWQCVVPAGFEGLAAFGSPGRFGECWPWCGCHGSLATELRRVTS